MKLFKKGVILLTLLFAMMVVVSIVSADDKSSILAMEDLRDAAINVNEIKLPQLKFDNSQEKVVVNSELSPSEGVQSSQIIQLAITSQNQPLSKIPYGAIIYHSKDGVTTVFDSNGNQLFAAEDAKAIEVTTPQSDSPATFVHEIPTGSIVKERKDAIFIFFDSQLILTLINDAKSDQKLEKISNLDLTTTCGNSGIHPFNGNWLGWIEDVQSTPTSLTRFEATWEAPRQTPRNSGVRESLAIFNGIDCADINGIMQPVLMWNFFKDNDYQPHLYYTGAAWDYRSSSTTDQLHSTPISVSPGDNVRGKIQWSPTLNLWIIQFDNLKTGFSTAYYSDRFPRDNLALSMALEATGSGIKPNDQSLPGSITFYNIIIQNNGKSVPVTFTGDICPLASNYFSNLEAKIYQNPLSVLLRTDRSQPKYIITATADQGGQIKPSGSVVVKQGEQPLFTVKAESNTIIESVVVDNKPQSIPEPKTTFAYTFPSINENGHTISATFTRVFTITPGPGSHGLISPSIPQNVPAGGRQTFTISPDQGYVIADVKVNKESVGAVPSYTFDNVQQDSTIRVTFKRQPTYTITPNAGSHGTISPSTPQKVVAGGSQIFTISANTGYIISDVLVDGTSVGAVNSYTFENMQANYRIMATFKPSPSTFTITSKAGSGGSINPLGAVTVPAGRSQTYTITPNSGYMITEVSVDGLPQGAISTYTFNNVQADHTISSSFKPASTPGPDWIWSRDGWGDWEHTATWDGNIVEPCSEYGPVIINGHGEHGANVNLNYGSGSSSVWRTFTDPSGSGWNTIIFEGLMSGSDVGWGRWMTIDVNGQQVFYGIATQTPPGNNQMFEITRSFPQSPTVTVKISNGQNPLWGPWFYMEFHSLKLTQGTALRMTDTEAPFVIPDGSGLVTNATAPQ